MRKVFRAIGAVALAVMLVTSSLLSFAHAPDAQAGRDDASPVMHSSAGVSPPETLVTRETTARGVEWYHTDGSMAMLTTAGHERVAQVNSDGLQPAERRFCSLLADESLTALHCLLTI